MGDNEHDDRWRAEIVDDDSAPLPEPWFLRDLRSRNALAESSRTGPERRTLPSDESLNLGRRHDDRPVLPAVPFWRRWWPVAAGVAAVFLVLILVLFVPPRVDGASTPIDVAPETATTVAAVEPAEAAAPVPVPVSSEMLAAADQAPANTVEQTAAVAPDSNPSFDCDDVASRVNKMICASPQLAALDRQLAARQAEVGSQLDPGDRDELERSRAEFMGHKLQCDDEDCIARAYEDRMTEIDEIDEFAEDSDRR